MDAVNAFNGEMLSMIEMTPPISRAKMMSVTKAGIKAIKLYKHVVQIVEKFIKKCNPNLKVAGLYVVDSIIRQSRHQFGPDKDVFGPRFLKNFNETFQNLFQCPDDDKGKILRVLALWQKNEVFGLDIIKPLSDLAAASVLPVIDNGLSAAAPLPTPVPVPQPVPALVTKTTSLPVEAPVTSNENPDLSAVAQLLQGLQGAELQQLLLGLQPTGGVCVPQDTQPKTSLAKTLLDRFDYDDEPEPVEEKIEPAPATAPFTINLPPELQQALQAHLLSQLVNQAQMQMQGQTVMEQPATSKEEVASQRFPDVPSQLPENTHIPEIIHDERNNYLPVTQQSQPQGSPRPDRVVREHKHGRRSRSRSPRRRSSSHSRRSRSGSRSRWSKHRPTDSRSRERRGNSEERRQRERDRERRQNGLPSMKKETLSVCSTTLWVGQLDKKCQQQDITTLIEEFGQIDSINMIPPRGCAYVVMVHRQDAHTALNRLSRGVVKVNQKAIKIAWALNKGITSDFKRFWDVDRGVTYIPWEKVKPENIKSLREGGMFDPETLKPEWKDGLAKPSAPVTEGPEGIQGDGASLPVVLQSPGIPPVAIETVVPGLSPPPAFPRPGFKPAAFTPVVPVAAFTDKPAEEPSMDFKESPVAGGQPLSPPPSAGPRRFLPPHLPAALPPFLPPFANNGPARNLPPNMPLYMMPPRCHNPMLGELPLGRFRAPMMARPDFQDKQPWGPRFGNEGPFFRGVWGRGGPPAQSRFGN